MFALTQGESTVEAERKGAKSRDTQSMEGERRTSVEWYLWDLRMHC